MREKGVAIAVFASMCALAAACSDPPLVAQGTVASWDEKTQVLVLNDEVTKAEMVFSLAGGEIGSKPEDGDLVRLAYRKKGEKLVATRLMNMTRQAELSGGGGGH